VCREHTHTLSLSLSLTLLSLAGWLVGCFALLAADLVSILLPCIALRRYFVFYDRLAAVVLRVFRRCIPWPSRATG